MHGLETNKNTTDLAIMGRTGKKNPRLAEDFLVWADEESIIKIVLNTYKFERIYRKRCTRRKRTYRIYN